MGKTRSIEQQIIHAIADCSAIGESKRSYKGQHGGDTNYKIFSIKYRDDLQITARDLGRYLKAEHPDLRRVRDLTPDALQDYLQGKADSGCSAVYISKLISHVNKLQVCCTHTYGRSDWHTDQLRVPALPEEAYNKKRDKVATDQDYMRLIGIMRQPGRSDAYKAVVLSRILGLRVNEAASVRVGRLNASGGRWGCGTITLQGKEDGAKGGRWRNVDILNPDHRRELQDIIKGLDTGGYIIQSKSGQPLKPDSINRALQRAVQQDPEVAAHWQVNNGLHAFRKAFAQECYDAARHTGCSKKEAADYANKQLGHGHDRSDLINVYIANLW